SRSNRSSRKTNPKSEYRNPKQTQRQINLKSGKSKTPNHQEACLEFYTFRSFEIVSNFGFRASNFLFLAPLREIFRPLSYARTFVVKCCGSFQKAQVQGAINTNFLLHSVAAKPLGL